MKYHRTLFSWFDAFGQPGPFMNFPVATLAKSVSYVPFKLGRTHALGERGYDHNHNNANQTQSLPVVSMQKVVRIFSSGKLQR